MASGKYYTLFDRLKDLPKYIANISNITPDYYSLIDKNRLGAKEKSKDEIDISDDTGIHDIIRGLESKERGNIPYFSKAYNNRVNQLLIFAANPEIQFIIHSIGNDAISSDENNTFCKPTVNIPTLKQEIKDNLQLRFNKIYSYYGFSDQSKTSAWAYFVRWLIEGFLAFEIIYNDKDNPTEVIGFEERNPSTLIPLRINEKYEEDGQQKSRKVKIWKQVVIDERGKEEIKVLPDNSIIFIAYNKMPGADGRFSYIERLIRSFNLKRTMENTRVAYAVQNSQFRLKLVLPVGTKNTNKAKQALATTTNKYKEDLTIDHDSGEVMMNGQPLINFGKTIVLPSRNGQEPKVESIAFAGPDLSNMDAVKHFERNLWRDSGMPFGRFDHDKGGGVNVLLNTDQGIPNDEKQYNKMLGRFRKQFDVILTKPLYIQMVMDYPALREDMEFKTKLCMVYESDSMFELAKEEEIENHKLMRINNYTKLRAVDGVTPVYSVKYLYITKFEIMTEDEWKKNQAMILEEYAEIQKIQKKLLAISPLPPGEEALPGEKTPDNPLASHSNDELVKKANDKIDGTLDDEPDNKPPGSKPNDKPEEDKDV